MVRLPPDRALQSAMLATGGWSEARVVQLPAQEVSARSVGLTLQLVSKQPSAEDNATVMNKSIQWVAVPTALSREPFISMPRPGQSVSRALLTLSEIVKTYISSSRHHQQTSTHRCSARLTCAETCGRRRESSTADERAATRRLIPKGIWTA